MITQRAYLIGVVGFCFYLIALVNTLPSFYYVLTWLSVSLLVSSFGIALLSLVGLSCSWHVGRASVAEASDDEQHPHKDARQSLLQQDNPLQNRADGAPGTLGPLVEVELANKGTLNKTGVMIEVQLQRVRRGKKEPGVLRRRFLIEALSYGSSVATALPLRNLPRGRYHVSGLRLIGSDVLGLFRIQRRLENLNMTSADEEHELVIGPAMVALHNSGLAALAGSAAYGPDATRYVGQSDEMRGTRFYVPGDDLRQVHWKSTARQGQLVVKEFHNAAQSHSLIVWDGAEVLPREETQKESEIWGATEWGLRVVASLCRAMIDTSQPSTLLRLDSQPLLVGFKSHGNQSPLTLDQVTKELSEADAARTTPLSEAIEQFTGVLGSGGTVYLVTASPSPDVVLAVKKWQAREMRVVVALINGSAFPNTLRKAMADKLKITRDDYATQLHSLRAISAHVVAIEPQPRQTHYEFTGPIRTALHQLLLIMGDRVVEEKG